MRFLFIAILISTGIISLGYTPAYAAEETAKEFEKYLQKSNLKTPKNTPLYKDDLMSFYAARDYEPVWFDDKGRSNEDIQDLVKTIEALAYSNGLAFSDYDFTYAHDDKADQNLTSEAVFEREWVLTNSVMHYINDVRTGRIKPHKYDSMIFNLPQHRALDERMGKLVKARNQKKYLESLAPQQPEYAQLKATLHDLREIAQKGGWAPIEISKNAVIRPGETHEVIPQIRKRLDTEFHNFDGVLPKDIWIDDTRLLATEELSDRIVHKDLVKDVNDIEVGQENAALIYDPETVKRVAEFQYFHGLKADGVIGPKTIKALSQPVDDQIDKVILSMERWRWLPDDLGRKHVRANIAAFYVRAVENGKDQFVMPIIVGKVAHQTPVFSSVIKNVKIHPDWTSPSSIAGRYVIPKIQKNPKVIHKLGYQVQDKRTGQFIPWENVNIEYLHEIDLKQYQFRQKPGVRNALGLARFSIDNNYAIFMHGTPSQALFEDDERDHSSGCIRLENPLVMAHFLLNDQGMSKNELEDLYLLNEGEFPDTTYVDLSEDVPVHLMYMTAWVDQEGHVHFSEDVYGRDTKLKRALERLN